MQQKQKLSKGQVDVMESIVAMKVKWNTLPSQEEGTYEIDLMAFAVNDKQVVTCDEDFVFYNNLVHPSEFIQHTGDCRTEDNETLLIEASKTPDWVDRTVIIVTMYTREMTIREMVDNFIISFRSVDVQDDGRVTKVIIPHEDIPEGVRVLELGYLDREGQFHLELMPSNDAIATYVRRRGVLEV